MKPTSRAVIASTLPLLGAAMTIFFSAGACASGFALNEMSAAGVANAHAGGAAAAEDIGTLYYNPAGLTRLPGRRFMAVGSAIRPSAKFTNQGSLFVSGSNGGDAGDWALVPALYYAMELQPGLHAGVGVQSPFGLRTEYDSNWVGRYQALKSELKSININPALAWRINDNFSIGAGVSAQYIDVTLSRALDFGSICAGSLGAGPCASAGLRPQGSDGIATVDGNDWGYGYNLGLLFAPDANSRFGISYRSKISHELSGNARYAKPAALPARIAAAPAFSDTSASAGIDLPESVNLSGYVDLDSRWSVMADVNWMRWSRFKELRIRFDNGAPDSVTPEEWRNTFRFAVALNYRYNDAWKLRAGVAYDQSPVKTEFRTPRIPDADRTWLAFGAQYRISPRQAWDFGYAHLFVKDSTISKAEPPVGGTLIGTYNNDVNILSVQYSHAF
jgi:long-chain fatty acid transport protein